MRYREDIYHRMGDCYNAIVATYTKTRRPATMREISQSTGLAVSYVHGILQKLVAGGFVEKSGDMYVPDCVIVEIDKNSIPTQEQFRNADLSHSGV